MKLREATKMMMDVGVSFTLTLFLGLVPAMVRGKYLEEDLKNLKVIITSLQEKLEEFGQKHLEKMDRQMEEITTRLDHLDKNVRLLHERSIAWDSIAQSARDWEALLRVVDGKVDVVKKRQEALITGEPPLTGSAYISRRQVLDVIAGRVNALDSKVTTILKRMADENIVSGRHRDGIVERLIRLEGRTSVLQDGQQKIKEAMKHPYLCPIEQFPSTTSSPIPSTKKPPKSEDGCEIKIVLRDFLEDLAADDDVFGTHRSPRSRGTEVLFRKIWRKFQNPVNKINRRLETLEQLMLHANDLCNQSNIVSTKVQHALVRGECAQVNIELRRFTTRTDEQLAQLETKITRHMIKLGKVIDKASRENLLITHPHPATCDQVLEKGFAATGIYIIQPTYDDVFEAFCDLHTEGGGWTVIQRRGNYGFARENFNRDWEGYRQGFGDPRREFWIGNDRLTELTNRENVVLRVELTDWDGNFTYAEYTTFKVGEEDEKYVLRVGNYSGNASDSLGAHNGKFFSTYDVINDESPSCCPCSRTYLGGWWFYSCFESHLNGIYLADPLDNDFFQGIIWEHWRGDYSLHSSEMKIRPRHLHYKFTGRGGSTDA